MSPLSLQELLEAAKHKAYFADHQGEFPFPIDGSEWSRLVSTRISHEHHLNFDKHRVQDFWTWLHHSSGPVKRQRKTIQRALHHWFLLGSDSYGLPWYEYGKETNRQIAWTALHNLQRMKEQSELSEVESDWMKDSSAAKVWLPKSSKHWIGGDAENWEPRPNPRLKAGVYPDEQELNQTIAIMDDLKDSPFPLLEADDLEKIEEIEDEVFYLPDRTTKAAIEDSLRNKN